MCKGVIRSKKALAELSTTALERVVLADTTNRLSILFADQDVTFKRELVECGMSSKKMRKELHSYVWNHFQVFALRIFIFLVSKERMSEMLVVVFLCGFISERGKQSRQTSCIPVACSSL